jgi:CheY-like chemotaxis protein
LRQILLNLVSNAIKFTESGSVHLTVQCEPVTAGAAQVRIVVTDTGIGIPRDKLSLLFEKFVQADSSTTRRFGGTGLGLAICQQLVTLMGGAIEVASDEGRGSTFTVRLAFPVGGSTEAAPPGATEVRAAVSQPWAGRRILLVEDNPVNQRVGQRFLERLGCVVTIAADGGQALELMEPAGPGCPFDLMLMDCQMPVLDGFETTRAVRRLELSGGGHVPVIAMTASALDEDRLRCYDSGMDDHITKPIQLEEIERVLSRWLPRAMQ